MRFEDVHKCMHRYNIGRRVGDYLNYTCIVETSYQCNEKGNFLMEPSFTVAVMNKLNFLPLLCLCSRLH